MKTAGRIFTALGLLLTAGCAALTAWAWPRLPGQVPLHWNWMGQIDRWADKSGLLGFIAIGALLFLMLWAMAAVCAYAAKNDVKEGCGPEDAQRGARRIYTILMGGDAVLAGVFFYVTVQMTRSAVLSVWLGPVTLLLMAAMTVGLLWQGRRARRG